MLFANHFVQDSKRKKNKVAEMDNVVVSRVSQQMVSTTKNEEYYRRESGRMAMPGAWKTKDINFDTFMFGKRMRKFFAVEFHAANGRRPFSSDKQ
jgi:hypothetical protein